MRVAMVAPRFYPSIGGVETHVKSIAERLVQAGVEVDVFTTDPQRRLPEIEQINRVTIRRYPAWAPGDAYYISPLLLTNLWRRARTYDLIHAHSYQALTCLCGGMVAGKRLPFVFTPHYHGRGETRVRNILHRPWRLPGGWLFRRARRIICVSAAELARLTRQFPFTGGRAIIIPNGVQVDNLRAAVPYPREARDRQTVLYVGRLERYKNIDRVVASLPYLPASSRLVIVGNGPYKVDLLRQISHLGLSGRVQIKSDVSDEELFRLYKSCDLCVNLSSSEAFGITLLEAMAAGKPVLVNDIPAFQEIGKLSTMIQVINVQQLDDAGLARALVDGMSRSGDPPDLADYTWDEVARRTLHVYRELLGGG
jgi:glycosyltransferase involved in cell wall biosynthesis